MVPLHLLPHPLSKLAAPSEISQGAQHQLFPSGYPVAILTTDWRGGGEECPQLRCVDDGSILFLSLSTPNPLPAKTHGALCHWHPGSGGMSPQTAFPRGTPQKWWLKRSWWSWAGRSSRQRSSSGSGRTNTARWRRAWTTAGWSATQSRATTSAPGNGCSWRTCAPKYILPTVGLSYSGTVKDGMIKSFPFPLSSWWCVRGESERVRAAHNRTRTWHPVSWVILMVVSSSKKGNLML